MSSFDLLQALEDAGVPVPPYTRSVSLHLAADDAAVLRLEVLLTADLLHRIASATAAHLVKARLVNA